MILGIVLLLLVYALIKKGVAFVDVGCFISTNERNYRNLKHIKINKRFIMINFLKLDILNDVSQSSL